MTDRKSFTGRRWALATSLVALLAAMPAAAQQAPAGQPVANATVNLINLMVTRGLISREDADQLIRQAEAEAAQAAKTASQAAAPVPPGSSAQAQPAADGAVHVQYVPQIVRDQIKDEVKQEVMAQAKDEGWAAPDQVPEWVNRIKVSGDIRLRSEEDMFPKGNAGGTTNQLNFMALQGHNFTGNGTLGGIAPSAYSTLPYYNADQDRQRERLRARLAVDADLGDGFASEIRLATGSDSQPVSTNQTLGASGGDFSKYQLWLDRAFLRYEPLNTETAGFSATFGRFANPFFSTDLIWYSDLNFDGFVTSGRYQVAKGVTPWFTLGAFPVFDTDLNFSTDDTAKDSSNDKWLLAAQGGTDWKATKDTAVRVGAAYYYFNNVAGKSVTCANNDDPNCGSQYAPSFAQHGNTYFELRNNPNSTVNNPAGIDNNNYEYYGLASGFHELALTGRVDYDGLKPLGAKPFRVTLDGEYVKNLAFDKSLIQSKSPQNNVENSRFAGGDTGAMLRVTAGAPELTRLWDWNVSLAYKYVESDAVMDAFNDPDFGLTGGTNLKGFVLGGSLAFTKAVWANLRWLSADSISGAPYSEDTVMLDLNAKF